MTKPIEYPRTWTADHVHAMQMMFVAARTKGLWFHSTTMVGDFWFSPDELELEQRACRYVWTSDNWRLRNPDERVAEIDRARSALAIEKRDLELRIRRKT